MTKRDKMNNIWRPGTVALLVLALCPFFAIPSAAGKKEDPPKKVDLVWPLPPEKPRVRWEAVIRGAFDVEPMKKANFLDRVAGIEKRDFKPSFLKPYGIATDSKHRIYVTDSAQGIVFVLDREQHKVSYLGVTLQVHLRGPLGITVDRKDRVWVADAVGQHVYAFDSEGNLLMALGKVDEMVNPTGVAVDDARNRLYVTDSKGHCVLVYSLDTGELVTRIGKRGSGDGEFNFPTNIVLDQNGRLYVSDTMNFRVQIFDPDYKFVDSFGQQGVRWGQFSKAKGIALDDQGNIYVVDSDFCNIQVFDAKKRLLLFFGGYGTGPGGMWLPAGMHISDHTIYVADQNNRRIQIFKIVNNDVVEEPPVAVPGGGNSHEEQKDSGASR